MKGTRMLLAILSVVFIVSGSVVCAGDRFVRIPQLIPQSETVDAWPEFNGRAVGEMDAANPPVSNYEYDYYDYDVRDYVDEKGTPFDELGEMLSFETLNFDLFTRTTTNVLADLSNAPEVELDRAARISPARRRKRHIFGTDTRFPINGRSARRFPFTAIAKLSPVKCSGVLVSNRHILTAARCIHDGFDYVEGIQDLSVGLRRMDAYEQVDAFNTEQDEDNIWWFKVSQTFLPRKWMREAGEEEMVAFNYAVIELKRELLREYMKVGITSADTLKENYLIHMTGYEDEVPFTPTYRFCPIVKETSNLIYHRCDTTDTSNGAPMYTRMYQRAAGTWERKIVGINSGYQWVNDQDGVTDEYNSAVRISALKFAQICYWTIRDYDVCRSGQDSYIDIDVKK